MYPQLGRLPISGERVRIATVVRRWFHVSQNVVYLGLTSMFTDISSEMVNAVLPLYLVVQLRFNPLVFGAFAGAYQGVTALGRVTTGLMADRHARHKELAGAGYGISAICKLGLLVAGGAGLPTSAILFLDRTGKGVRTTPRDALISLSSSPERVGEAFGVHRALDTLGALAGPLLAFALLSLTLGAFDAIFVTSFCMALIGLGFLVFFVKNARDDAGATPRPRTSLGTALRLVRERGFRTILLVGALLGLVTITDAFVYLTFQTRSSMSFRFFPLLFAGTAVSYLVLAIPMGRLADRLGRGRVFLAGYALLLCVDGLLLAPSPGALVVIAALLCLGAYYAATDGVLMALTSSVLPPHLRGSGLALVSTATTVAQFAASLIFGAVWALWGLQGSVIVFAVGIAVALPVAALALRGTAAAERQASLF
jgi:MFS family permease